MRFLLTIAALAFAAVAQAAPPKYVVVDKTTPCFVVTNKTTKAVCVCGDTCECSADSCPSKCPVATKPDLVTTTGNIIRWTGREYVFVGQSPVTGCPNGKCNLKR